MGGTRIDGSKGEGVSLPSIGISIRVLSAEQTFGRELGDGYCIVNLRILPSSHFWEKGPLVADCHPGPIFR